MGAQAKPLKAYSVTETTESTGGIVYAKTNAQARREGSCAFGDGDFHGWECRRAPEFDCYAPEGPSREVMFEHGWWFECEECSGHARQDSGGILFEGRFYCGDHADFYAWREPRERTYYRRDDYVWEQPRFWWPVVDHAAIAKALGQDAEGVSWRLIRLLRNS